MNLTIAEDDFESACEMLNDSECELLRHLVTQFNKLSDTNASDERLRRQSEIALNIVKLFGAIFLSNLKLVDESASENLYSTIPENSDNPSFEAFIVKLKTGYYILSISSLGFNSFEIYEISNSYDQLVNVYEMALNLIKQYNQVG